MQISLSDREILQDQDSIRENKSKRELILLTWTNETLWVNEHIYLPVLWKDKEMLIDEKLFIHF